jgi:hypothetical protein
MGYHSAGGSTMQKRLLKVGKTLSLAAALMVVMGAPAWTQTKKSEGGSMPKVGEVAPEFKLEYFDGNDSKEVSLSQYRGKKNVVLGFFIFAFTGG